MVNKLRCTVPLSTADPLLLLVTLAVLSWARGVSRSELGRRLFLYVMARVCLICRLLHSFVKPRDLNHDQEDHGNELSVAIYTYSHFRY